MLKLEEKKNLQTRKQAALYPLTYRSYMWQANIVPAQIQLHDEKP